MLTFEFAILIGVAVGAYTAYSYIGAWGEAIVAGAWIGCALLVASIVVAGPR